MQIDIEDSEESSFSSSSDCDSKADHGNKKTIDKMSDITLLSAEWCAKMKSGTKVRYYNVSYREDFIVKWLMSLIEVALEVERDNRYDYIDCNINKIINYVLVFGNNSSRFNMNFLINFLYHTTNHNIENIIGNLIYFKQVTLRKGD
jgi:hypothetical protein